MIPPRGEAGTSGPEADELAMSGLTGPEPHRDAGGVGSDSLPSLACGFNSLPARALSTNNEEAK